MAKGKASGYALTKSDAKIVLGMLARGDRDHDIAGHFGVNQGRIADVKAGKFGTLEAAPAEDLPPKGPPGIKGRRLRIAAGQAVSALQKGDLPSAMAALQDGVKRYDANET